MISIIGHNIYTGIGFGSRVVYDCFMDNRTGLSARNGDFGVPDSFFSSLFDRGEIDSRFSSSGLLSGGRFSPEDFSPVEKAMALSAADALKMAGIDASRSSVLFILSSTKGNVEMLENDSDGRSCRLPLWHSASLVASLFGNRNTPVCVTNACTSGLCAQISALRALESGEFSHAVVIGADMLSRFVISGFQSLKALSAVRCRPFDKSRSGLNLSEAVSTIVFSGQDEGIGITLERGCIRNDANHISAPSRTGDGQYAAIRGVLDDGDIPELSFINAHGTATIYNDNMESVALHRAGLDGVPLVSCKSFFGHTLGAAGVMETVVSSLALLEGKVPPTYCYRESGVDFPMNISDKVRCSSGNSFLKIMSGFGGINAACLYRRK